MHDGFLAEAFHYAEVGLPDNLQESFIHAVHQTVHDNPQFLSLLGENVGIAEVGDGFRTSIPTGELISPAHLYSDPDFLATLQNTVHEGPYRSLQAALGNDTSRLFHEITLAAERAANGVS